MTIIDNILAPEIASQFVVERDIEVGDLCVFIDYAGREIGARVTHVMGDTVVGKVCGLNVSRPYTIGMQIARDRKFWSRAI